MVITLRDYAKIRRLFNSGTSKRAIAKKLGISRNTAGKYCQGNTTPWNKKSYTRHSTIISDEVMDFIRQCLEEDELGGVRKQRHTAKRIFDRLIFKSHLLDMNGLSYRIIMLLLTIKWLTFSLTFIHGMLK